MNMLAHSFMEVKYADAKYTFILTMFLEVYRQEICY